MSSEERLIRAHDLSVSALLGDTIYNFGELVSKPMMMNLNSIILKKKPLIFACIQLMHPILDSLNGTQHEWLKKLLFTFNEGNIGKFEALAPLFPKEVSSFSVYYTSMGDADSHLNAGYPTRKLPLPPSEDLSHGSY